MCEKQSDTYHQGITQDLETGCLKLAIVKFWASKFSRGNTIYSDFNHKYEWIYQNKAWCTYTISWELRGDEQSQLCAWDWHFKKFLTEKFGCPEGCYLRAWVSKKTPCWLRPCLSFPRWALNPDFLIVSFGSVIETIIINNNIIKNLSSTLKYS